MKLNIFSKYVVRHALSVGFAVMLTIFINYHVMHSNECWMVLSAFLVGQTTRGTALRQGLIFITVLIAAVIVSSLLKNNFENNVRISIVAIVYLFSACFVFIKRPMTTRSFLLANIFSIMLLFAMLLPSQSQYDIRMQIVDIVIGSVIGLLCAQFIFPVNLEKEFRSGLIPILSVIKNYAQELTNNFQKNNKDKLYVARLKLEKMLLKMYPEWIYEPGFNPGLRSGFRFFLINIERIVELLFSMNYLGSKNIQEDLEKNIMQSMIVAMQKNIELFDVINGFLDKNTLINTRSDYTSDMTELEKNLQQIVPDNVDLLDLSPDYLTLTTYVRDIKDMRGILLQLVMSLPATRSA